MPHILSRAAHTAQRSFSLLNHDLMTRNLLFLLLLLSGPAQGMEIRTAWISMPDGVRLSADLYQPTGGSTAAKFRSEEHTSELQSQSNLVCRLLLEKKKNIKETNS